jgi:hypothetical protein
LRLRQGTSRRPWDSPLPSFPPPPSLSPSPINILFHTLGKTILDINNLSPLNKTKFSPVYFSGCRRHACAVELKFEDPAAGFFLRSVDTATAAVVPSTAVAGTNALGGELSAAAAVAAVPPSDIGDDDRQSGLTSSPPPPIRQFALLKSSQTVVLRAAYGPFLSSQTVTPSSSRVALFAADYQSASLNNNGGGGSNNVSFSEPPPTTADAVAAASGSPYLDLSAHLVTREVRKDQPVLRVVFHAGQSVRQHGAPPRKKVGGGGGGMCIVLSAQLTSNKTVEATCTPQGFYIL